MVLEAADMGEAAEDLRDLPELSDRESLVRACGALRRIRVEPVPEEFWKQVVEEAAFWCEAAVWAAARGDPRSFADHVERANAAMRRGLPVSWIH